MDNIYPTTGIKRTSDNRFTLKRKVITTMGILLVVIGVTTAFGVFQLGYMNKKLNEIVDVQSNRQLLSAQVKQDILRIHRAEKSLILEVKAVEMDKYSAAIEEYELEMRERLETLSEIASFKGRKSVIRFVSLFDQWKKVDIVIRRLTREASNIRARDLSSEKGRLLFDKVEQAMDTIVTQNDALLIKDLDSQALLLVNQRIVIAARIKQDMLRIHRAEKSLILEIKQEEMDKYSDAIEEYEQEMHLRLDALVLIASPSGRSAITNFINLFDEWKKVDLLVRDLSRESTNIRARDLSSGQGRVLFDLLEQEISQIIKNVDEEMSIARISSNKDYKNSRDILAALSVFAIVVFLIVAALFDRVVVQPVLRLKSYASEIGQGKFYANTESVSNDEIGDLAVSFQDMSLAIKQLIETEQKATLQQKKKAVESLELSEHLIQRTTELEYANKELDGFSYSVSHDLRAPIRGIVAFSTILGEEYSEKLDAEGKRLLLVISNNAARMGLLIDDLLAFARIGRHEVRKTKVDMTMLVKSLLEEIEEEFPENNIEFKVMPLPSSRCDAKMMKQVFINLLSNAVKFSSNEKDVVVEVGYTADNDVATYYVKDSGVGFDMQYADKLFVVFQRLHKATEFDGSGVGLAIAEKIVNKHGGRIWAESEVNKGAKFHVLLPS